MTYYRTNLATFTTWHNTAKIAEGLPRVGYINGVPAPQNQQTVNYSTPIQNPNGSDDYVWLYGAYPINGKTDLSAADVAALNWIVGD